MQVDAQRIINRLNKRVSELTEQNILLEAAMEQLSEEHEELKASLGAKDKPQVIEGQGELLK